MNKNLRLLPCIPLLAAAAMAQPAPRLELFGGYSYFGLPAEKSSGLTAASLNGWSAAASLNLRPRIGLVVDFGGNYGTRRMLPTPFQPVETRPGAYRQFTMLLGPEVRVFANERFSVNIRALIGGADIETLVLPLPAPIPQPDLNGNPQPPLTEFRFGGEKPVAGALGGSLDYRISERFSWRVQPELVVLHLGSTSFKSLRLSTGIVFRLGGW
jgi:hypothetical protein